MGVTATRKRFRHVQERLFILHFSLPKMLCMSQDRLWILLARKKSGEAPPAEIEELEYLLQQNNISPADNDLIDAVWDKLTPLPNIEPDNSVWQHIQQKTSGANNRLRIFPLTMNKWLAAASLFALVIISAVLVFQFRGNKINPATSPLSQTKTSKNKLKFNLPDGTIVWLNKNSEISYNTTAFGKTLREISLTGEAFFDVVKNESLPFVIHTGTIDIRVKGTAFNVKAYPGQKSVETALVRGLIEITTKADPGRKIILKPDEKFIIPVETTMHDESKKPETTDQLLPQPLYSIVKLKSKAPEKIAETSWLESKLVFDNETFEELAPKLESWFDVKINIQSEELKNRVFSGVIEKESLQQTLEAMALSYPFRFSIKENSVFITKK